MRDATVPERGGKGEREKGRKGVLLSHAPVLSLPFFLFFIAIICWGRPAQAQEVRAYVSADSVSIGERFRLSLAAEHRAGTARFPNPALGDTLLGDLEVIARVDTSRRVRGRRVHVDSAVYEVTTFALDSAYVPPLPVRFVGENDTLMAVSGPLVVPVRSVVPADAESPRDLAPLADFPRSWWPWLLGLAAALLLLGAAYYAWRRYRTRGGSMLAEPDIPPYEQAQQRLRVLEDETDMYDPAHVKPFYVELADVARRYLERRTGLPALEETTREMIDDLNREAERGRLPGDTPSRLHRVLSQADLVKFADVRPPTEKNREMLSDTRATLEAVEQHLLEKEREEARRREREEKEEAPETTAAPPE